MKWRCASSSIATRKMAGKVFWEAPPSRGQTQKKRRERARVKEETRAICLMAWRLSRTTSWLARILQSFTSASLDIRFQSPEATGKPQRARKRNNKIEARARKSARPVKLAPRADATTQIRNLCALKMAGQVDRRRSNTCRKCRRLLTMLFRECNCSIVASTWCIRLRAIRSVTPIIDSLVIIPSVCASTSKALAKVMIRSDIKILIRVEPLRCSTRMTWMFRKVAPLCTSTALNINRLAQTELPSTFWPHKAWQAAASFTINNQASSTMIINWINIVALLRTSLSTISRIWRLWTVATCLPTETKLNRSTIASWRTQVPRSVSAACKVPSDLGRREKRLVRILSADSTLKARSAIITATRSSISWMTSLILATVTQTRWTAEETQEIMTRSSWIKFTKQSDRQSTTTLVVPRHSPIDSCLECKTPTID